MALSWQIAHTFASSATYIRGLVVDLNSALRKRDREVATLEPEESLMNAGNSLGVVEHRWEL